MKPSLVLNFLTFFLLISLNSNAEVLLEDHVHSDDVLQNDPMIDINYYRGAYLVYDCLAEHYVCTRKLEFIRCKELRYSSVSLLDKSYGCIPFKKYKSDSLCHKKQLDLMSSAKATVLCQIPKDTL